MDKTYNDLMDIVNRTKKFDSATKKPSTRTRVVDEDNDVVPIEYDVDTKPKRKSSSSSLFGEDSAINNLLEKSTKKKTTKTTSTKKTTTAKKTTTKAKTEKAEKVEKVEEPKKATPKPKAQPKPQQPTAQANIDHTDPKNAQLYAALQNSLFSGGTDISEYMTEDEQLSETQESLQELRAKREAQKISAEISKEQQEYEQLFNGSLGSLYQEENNEEDVEETQSTVDVAQKNAQLASNLNQILNNLENKKNNPAMSVEREKRASDTTFELESGNKDLDKKIAEYYKRKQEKIDKYNAMEEEGLIEEAKVEKDEPVDYDAIFGGAMVTRDELMGIAPEKTEDTASDIETEQKPEVDEIVETNDEPSEITNEKSIEEVVETEETTKDDTTEEDLSEEVNETVEEVTEETSKENHIKSLLSDLLYSKKEFEEEIKEREQKESQNAIEVENSDQTPETTEEDRRKDYKLFWGAEKAEEDKFEDPNAETSEVVEGGNFVMTAAEPEPQEIVEYIDRSLVETAPADEESATEQSAEQNEDDNISEEIENVEEVAEEPIEEEKEEIDNIEENKVTSSHFVEDDDDDDDFIIRKNPSTQEVSDIEEKTEDTIMEESEEITSADQNESEEETTEELEEKIEELEDKIEELEEKFEELEETHNNEEEVVSNNNLQTEELIEDSSDNDDEDDGKEEIVENAVEEDLSSPSIADDNDDHFDRLVENERIYEQQYQKPVYSTPTEDDDNTFVMNMLPENKVDVFGNTIETEEDEETKEVVEEKDDTISKEEFYNEMARLQENLINELKGNNQRTEGVDFFAEKKPVDLDEKAEKLVDDIIEKFEVVDEIIETTEDNEKEEVVVEQEEVKAEEPIEEVGSKAEPVDPSEFDNYNLLNKDVALNEEDLDYQEKSEEEKEAPKDDYFYMSQEDKEKKAEVTDEFMTIYEEDSSSYKEVGDINIFKNIGNAVPSSTILKEQPVPETKETSDDEIETIYTLMGIEKRTVAKENKDIKVLYVASECQPFIASGGLADVAGSLPKAIATEGDVDIRVIMPLYGNIKADYKDKFEYLGNFTVHLSWRQEYCGLFRYFKDGVTYYFIDNERYFKRDKLYGYYDDGERFAYFSKAIVEALPHLNFFPDIIHCNDWQSSLVSAYIKTGNWSDFRYYKIKHIYTIHNVEYQGVYGMENLKDLFGIDYRFRNDVDYNGDINLTKAAIQYCDKFTTVSDSYCDNLKQPYCSRGLHHIIIRNEYKLSGIINGIDYDFYNPATDTHIFKNYDIACMEEKVLNKKLWQDEIGLPVDGDTPMIAVVSRLVSHKGLDLITKIIHNTLQQDIQLVVVGTGDQKYVDFFKQLESKYPTKVRVFVDTYSNEIARKAYAASDIFVMPSKIEPCGLSQMIASRYGSIPIVREVGGLKDSIRDFGCEGGGNGYTFTNYNPNDLQYQLDRAIKDYSNKSEWKEKMKICMSQDFTWKKPAIKYIDLYKSLMDN